MENTEYLSTIRHGRGDGSKYRNVDCFDIDISYCMVVPYRLAKHWQRNIMVNIDLFFNKLVRKTRFFWFL